MKDYYRLVATGQISERSEFPVMAPAATPAALIMDCDQVSGVNSGGIIRWIQWMEQFSGNGYIKIEFENLRQSLLRAASSITDFIPPQGRINSFYLYYWSDTIKEDKEFKFSRGKDFDDLEMKIPKFKNTEIDGQTVEFSIEPQVPITLGFYTGKILFI
jgi:hypothetical protein